MTQAPTGVVESAPDPPPKPRGARLARTWALVRPGLQAVQLLPGKHESLRLAAQALTLIGDATVQFLTGRR